jgi:hypothetical protein
MGCNGVTVAVTKGHATSWKEVDKVPEMATSFSWDRLELPTSSDIQWHCIQEGHSCLRFCFSAAPFLEEITPQDHLNSQSTLRRRVRSWANERGFAASPATSDYRDVYEEYCHKHQIFGKKFNGLNAVVYLRKQVDARNEQKGNLTVIVFNDLSFLCALSA